MKLYYFVLKTISASFILLFALPPDLHAQMAHNINITVTNIRNPKGVINIGLFKDEHSFKKQIPLKFYLASKKGMINGIVRYTIKNIPDGVYGIAVLDDENENQVMDYKFFLPKEGFGFGGYYLSGMKKPKFDDFKFELKANKSLTAKLRYLP